MTKGTLHMKSVSLIAAAIFAASSVSAMAAGYGSSNSYGATNKAASNYNYVAPQNNAKQAAGYVTDAEGMSLYYFDNDARAVSNCYERCATDWPPFYAAPDATPYGYFSVILRQDGAYQWAYKGQPLYYWSGDQTPGDRNGDGIGGLWHIVLK